MSVPLPHMYVQRQEDGGEDEKQAESEGLARRNAHEEEQVSVGSVVIYIDPPTLPRLNIFCGECSHDVAAAVNC